MVKGRIFEIKEARVTFDYIYQAGGEQINQGKVEIVMPNFAIHYSVTI
jgi:hypothetical protein